MSEFTFDPTVPIGQPASQPREQPASRSMPEAFDRLVAFTEQAAQMPPEERTGDLKIEAEGEATSNDGHVTAIVRDDKLASLRIDPDYLRDGDPTMVEQSIIDTVNQARAQFQQKALEAFRTAMTGLPSKLGDLQRIREDMQQAYKQDIDRIP